MKFKEKANNLLLKRLNEALKLNESEAFSRISPNFLDNYISNNKDEIYKLFGNNFHIIKKVIGTAQNIDTNILLQWFEQQNIADFGENVQNAIILFTKKVLADTTKADVIQNKIRNNFTIENIEFKKGQKLSKSLIKFVSDFAPQGRKKELQGKLGNTFDAYKNLLEKHEYINVSYYLRLSIDPIDFFNMGYTRTQKSCTRITWDKHDFYGQDYTKAVFTYLQTSTFIATLHFNEESAIRGKEGDYRRIYTYDWQNKFIVGNRPYGASSKLNTFLANSVERCFKELLNQKFLLSTRVSTVKNKTAINHNPQIRLSIDGSISSNRIGYIDALHYSNSAGDYVLSSWKPSYAIQESLLDISDNEEKVFYSLQQMKWNKKNPYKMLFDEVKEKIESMYSTPIFYHIFYDNYNLSEYGLSQSLLDNSLWAEYEEKEKETEIDIED